MSRTRKSIVKHVDKKKKNIKKGPRGGKYYLSDNGNKVYVTGKIGKTTE